MLNEVPHDGQTAIHHIAEEMRAAIAAPKCHKCGCFHSAVYRLSETLPAVTPADQEKLRLVLEAGQEHSVPEEYDCLGCPTCWPANALNIAADGFPEALRNIGAECPTEKPAPTRSWPPLPGNYNVLDNGGAIAVCTLTSKSLSNALSEIRPGEVAIVGTLYTENLGIERVVTNVLANPNISTLLVCGTDTRRRVGHLPGQALISLAAHGIDVRGRILEAKGRRPFLKNISRDAVDVFRREVAVIDLCGEERVQAVLDAITAVPSGNGARRSTVEASRVPATVLADGAMRLVLDPKGYFVVFPDRNRNTILVEHYENDGTLAHVVEGNRAEDLCAAVIARGLVSRLEHAAYVGKELARAEQALESGEPYVQDAAPEPADRDGCGCGSGLQSSGLEARKTRREHTDP